MNLQIVFLSIYTRKGKLLLAFIKASRTRNWIQHLFSSQDLMQDLIAMDRCKYRKCMMTYIADMEHLHISDPDVWNYFLDGSI